LGCHVNEFPTLKLPRWCLPSLLVGNASINFLQFHDSAQEVATASGRKTISSSDVLQALEAAEFGDMLPKLTSELATYRSNLKKNPLKSNSAKPASNSSANNKTRVPQPKSGAAVTTKGPASTSGGQTRAEAEGSAEPKGDDDEEAFSEADIADEDGEQDGNQDEQGLDEDEDEDAGDEDEDEDEPGNTVNDEEMQLDGEDAGDASQSPR